MSGSTIGGVIGAVIGSYFGATQAGWMIGSAIGGYVDPDVIKGPRLTDAQSVTVQEGAARAFGYGTFVCSGNIIQAGPLVEAKHKERTGKGGPVQVTYTYSRTIAVAIGEPVSGVLRIWYNGKLMYDARDPAEWPDQAAAIQAMAADTAKFATSFVFYSGSETQQPDPSLQALPVENGGGYGNVPAYRGTAYLVFPNFDTTDSQGAVGQFKFEVSCCGSTTVTNNAPTWIHGNTGDAHSVEMIACQGRTFYTAGDAGALRGSVDGGTTWSGVDLTGSGIGPTEPLFAVWPSWYVASGTAIVQGTGTGNYMSVASPRHPIASGSATYVNGVLWAGAPGTITTIFQPLASYDTDISLGGDYGSVTTIGMVGGRIVVGCSDLTIRDTSGTVLCNFGGGQIDQFAEGGGIGVAATAGSYLRTTDGGATWTSHTSPPIYGVVYALGQFFGVTRESIYTSRDALTWTLADTFATGNTLATFITTDGSSVFACTQQGITSTLATTYNLPDIASGYWVDRNGTVHSTTTTVTGKCTAVLSDVVADLCDRVGLTSSQLDLSALTDDVRGFLIGRQMTAADAIRSLQQAFFFDMPEWGDYTDANTKLRAVKRGGPVLFELTDDDLLWSDEDEDTRAQAVEFPRKVNVLAPDVNADYNPVKQTAERQTQDVRAVGELTLEVPLSATRAEMAQIAGRMIQVAWTEAEGRWQRELPEEFTVLTPSDPFNHGGKRWRADRVELGDGSVKVEAVRDRISAYTSNLAGSTPLNPTPPAMRVRGPTVLTAMNLPQLVTQQNTPGMVVAVTGIMDAWLGCDLQLSVDNGATFQTVARITTESTMGQLMADCGTTGTIAIDLLHGHGMDSVTDAQIAARQNAWAITTNGVSEVGQTKTVDETGGSATLRTFDLTDNTRGELQTTPASHFTGDDFVLLDGNTTFVPISTDYAGRTVIFRPVSIGTVPENNKQYPVVYAPIYTTVQTVTFRLTEDGTQRLTEDGTFRQVD